MTKAVKPKRRYRSEQRELQAEATRTAVLDAARGLFAKNGWAGTTVAAIAKEAGVATETVYARFGNKRAIVQAMMVSAMRGGDPETPFMEQAARDLIRRQGDPRRMLAAFVTDITGLLARSAPVLAVVRSAAETDDEMRDLYAELHAARRRNLGQFVGGLADIGGLRDGLSRKDATDIVWALGSPEVFLLWTGVGGAGPDAHRKWLQASLNRLLLPDGD